MGVIIYKMYFLQGCEDLVLLKEKHKYKQ